MSLYFEKYNLFANLLNQIREELDSSQTNIDKQKLRQAFISLKHFYLEKILSAKTDIVNNSYSQQEQSYLTEISKQMRLLEMDITFFQGARQIGTLKGRLESIHKRLSTLLKYCDNLTQSTGGGNS
ncbi:heterocyst frequency control protein PatD [Mastigocoleus sp. MO_188.B34]|uniref:heterocyst frequency control protein PatD n=1 Tax=Mastigocoleus sp. MO_188.B34 TaxID=3036635 RepID=UPI002605697C|nr:heterocyst frequency control protein PatD [Mastigocoleus sp. MO_188.B34]MDJ0695671.1 heterocyst frequency control protein PatD [Mastigocoleus sp. MO_188.B34]